MVGVGDGGVLGVEGGRTVGIVAGNGNVSLSGIVADVVDERAGAPSGRTLSEVFDGMGRVVCGGPVGGVPVGVNVDRMRA